MHLLAAFERYGERVAIVWKGQSVSYAELRDEVERWRRTLADDGRFSNPITVALSADYSPRSLALMLALLDAGHVVAPITSGFDRQREELFRVCQAEIEAVVDADDQVHFSPAGYEADHSLLTELFASKAGGLVLFSSGSAGKIKAVVHHGERLLEKYRTPRRAKVTIPFMLFDHIGGINTVLHALSSGGTAVLPEDRTPQTICRLIEAHRVQVLPTTPTFLNLLLLSDFGEYDLSSLEILAYGAERMPESTLARTREAFPSAQLIQNYGMSEVGIMRTKSESSGSLWVELGGDGYEIRVRDGLLEIKAESAMLGYLNEESPFTEDGWLKTGDRVEVKGRYMRILGRESDIIIVGGEKVYPSEVEDLIAEMPNVVEVVVRGEPNAITGSMVAAEVRLSSPETRSEFRKRMAAHLTGKLPPFKLPQKVTVTKDPIHTARFKKKRSQ